MPKMKTNRSANKRFRMSGSGKLMREHAFKRHILTKKGRARKRALSVPVEVHNGDGKRIKRMLPYA